MSVLDWVPGDMLGLELPAHGEALRAGGEAFLTAAFHAAGALAPDNRVARITRFEECPGGSTGRKLLLSVEYEKPSADLHSDLFVKFSRDFDNALRDRAKNQMEAEIKFALLGRAPEFPIAVPHCYYADYHQETGTGVLITERVAYGHGGIERHYGKCLDYDMPEPLEHYKALVSALGRLVGTHKAGRLPASVERQFPFDPSKLSVNDRPPLSPAQLQRRIARYSEFAQKCPQLLPANIASQDFIARLAEQAMRFIEHEAAIYRFSSSAPDFIALCHWNANVDNAWFWRDPGGKLACGLMDWGHVSQMNVASALWGALCAAEIEIWDTHLDTLLALFASEVRRCGGPVLDIDELKLHMHLALAPGALRWLLDAPALIQAQIPEIAEVESRFDPRIKDNEHVRAQLHLLSGFLNLWETQDYGAVLDRFLARMQESPAPA